MRDHLKILGWLYAATGAFTLFMAACVGTILGLAGVFTQAAGEGLLVGGIGFAIAAFIAALSIPSLLCGWGLLTYRPWARGLGIVLSILKLPGVPIGTAIGGYGLWVLLNDDSKRLLEAGDPRFRQVGAGW